MTARSTAACMLGLPVHSIFSTAGRTARNLATLRAVTLRFTPFLFIDHVQEITDADGDADANADDNDDDTNVDDDPDDDEADDDADKDDANDADADAAKRWGGDSSLTNFRLFIAA